MSHERSTRETQLSLVLLTRLAVAITLALVPAAGGATPVEGDRPDASAADREQGYVVYRCRDGDHVTLSDRPCGPDAEIRHIDPADINTYDASGVPQIGSVAGKPSRVTPADDRDTSVALQHKARCERIAAELGRLESRMRAGYRGREGERLRERQREVKARQYGMGCRFVPNR